MSVMEYKRAPETSEHIQALTEDQMMEILRGITYHQACLVVCDKGTTDL